MALTATAEQSNSKRSLIIGIVIALHVVAIYIVQSGLAHRVAIELSPPVETKIIEEEKPPEEEPPPPPPPPEIPVQPPPFIPPPEVLVQTPPVTNAIQNVTTEKPPEVVPPIMTPPAPVAPKVVTVAPKVDGRRSRSCDDYYPPASNRADETGSVVVKCSVGVSGRCDAATVEQSSGYQRLDDAALKCAQQGLRFVAGTQGGSAATMDYSFKVTFKQKTN